MVHLPISAGIASLSLGQLYEVTLKKLLVSKSQQNSANEKRVFPRIYYTHDVNWTEMCIFLWWMFCCGIWDRCIVGFVRLVCSLYCPKTVDNAGNVFPPPRVSDPAMHHVKCVTHVQWCMLVSLTSGFLWSRWRRKRSRHSRRMRNTQFYVSDKRFICLLWFVTGPSYS